jgi:glycosyltransferase involved in cell wall biosynthesis
VLQRFIPTRATNWLRAAIRESVDESLELRTESIDSELHAIRTVLDQVMARDGSSDRLERIQEIVSAEFDDVPLLREELLRARESIEYERAFGTDEPLVSVRIATYNCAELLIERAISSVLAQSYERFEVIVVGDACTDDTEQRVAAVGDPRIRFVNLVSRAPYPEDVRNRWMVAGSPAMNLGAQLAHGLWIAPLDHDDEFVPDHIESLLSEARRRELELVYGKLLAVGSDGARDYEVGAFPPVLGQFGFQGAIHPAAFRFFQYNPKSWMLDEPGDWNLCRRMLEAGVRVGWLDQIVTRYYPSDAGRRPLDPGTVA